MEKCPYNFAARSRAAMIEAIEAISNRCYYDHRAWPFCWNVKDRDVWPESADELNPYHPDGDAFDPMADSAWREAMQGEGFYWSILEDARREVEDWSDYDGSHDYSFGFYGRMGGWLVLESCHGIQWRDLTGEDLRETLQDLPWPLLKKVYRGLVVMDSDFTPDNVRDAIRHALAWRRYQFEEDRREEASSLREELGELVGTLRGISIELRGAQGFLPPMVEAAARAKLAKLARRSRDIVAELKAIDGKGLNISHEADAIQGVAA